MRRLTVGRYSNHLLPLESVIVNNLYSSRSICCPREADTVLIVDSDAVPAPPIPRQRLQAIPGRNPQLVQKAHRIQLLQFPGSYAPQLLRASLPGLLRVAPVEDIFSPRAGEGLDHSPMVARLSCYCKVLSGRGCTTPEW